MMKCLPDGVISMSNEIEGLVQTSLNMGVLKLLTCGCCGILTVIDWFSVQNKVKEKNFNEIMMML